MRLDANFLEGVWEEAQVPFEAFKADAVEMEGYHEQMARDAFMAGLLSAVVIMERRLTEGGGVEKT